MEEWRVVPGTENKIEVSSYGRVKSNLLDGKILKTQFDQKGYKRVSFTINREKITKKVHRLVAEAFIPNEKHLPQVNHKDGDKTNNHVENLEWCSNYDNAHHAMEHGLWGNVFAASKRTTDKMKVKITATNIYTGERLYFESIKSAEKELGTKHISACLKGERRQAAGYVYERW